MPPGGGVGLATSRPSPCLKGGPGAGKALRPEGARGTRLRGSGRRRWRVPGGWVLQSSRGLRREQAMLGRGWGRGQRRMPRSIVTHLGLFKRASSLLFPALQRGWGLEAWTSVVPLGNALRGPVGETLLPPRAAVGRSETPAAALKAQAHAAAAGGGRHIWGRTLAGCGGEGLVAAG